MKAFKHFCWCERKRIEWWLSDNRSRRFIADQLERSVSSVSDEIRLNTFDGVYRGKQAQEKADRRRSRSKVQCMKVAQDASLKAFVIGCMKKDDQSPEAISGRLKYVETGIQYASAKAIYNFIASPNGRHLEKHLHSNAVPKRGGLKRDTPVTIDGRTMIDKRPKKVDDRLQFGHYEGDFIESGDDGTGSLLVLVERKTRYPFLRYVEDRTNGNINDIVAGMLSGYPIKSFTVDNDISFQKHEELSEIIDAAVFFCHPQCPHEKGTVENRNKAIRRYVRKKTDLSKIYPEYFSEVERKLRDRFMKCLKYKTPRETFMRELRRHRKPLACGILMAPLLV